MKYATKLRMMRSRANYSQRALGELIEVDFLDISKIEGGWPPPPDVDRRIREALGWTDEIDTHLNAIGELAGSPANGK